MRAQAEKDDSIVLQDYRDLSMYKSCLIPSKFLGSVGLGDFFEGGCFDCKWSRDNRHIIKGQEILKCFLHFCILELLLREELVFKAFRDFAIAESRWFWKAQK